MKRNFNELLAKMKPEVRERANARADAFLREMALADLRRARARTQEQLATALAVNQAWISRVERQTDMYLSTLRSYVEALGGQLEISVRFDDFVVRLNQFAELADHQPAAEATPDVPQVNATSPETPIEIWDSPESGDVRPAAIAADAPQRRVARPITTRSITTRSTTTSKAA